jgi:signal transduction histidine kinase
MPTADESELTRLLEVYRGALNLDFALQDSEAGESQIMPHGVISHLCKILKADGGNFSIYNANENHLDVRARYKDGSDGLEFGGFKKRFKEIGTRSDLRTQSSSYRCLDNQTPILIERSSIKNVEEMTLDVSTLLLKENLSAIAVPLKHHGQVMGVLNLDINNALERHFNQDDLRLLVDAAVLLPPILHNVLTIETITKISEAILRKTRTDNDKAVLSIVCELICDFLFVPAAAIFLRDEALRHRVQLSGFHGRIFENEMLDQLTTLNALELEGPLQTVLARTCPYAVGTVAEFLPAFRTLDPKLECRALNLKDKSGLVDGALMIIGSDANPIDSFQRLCNFIAEFTSLTLGALKQFDFRTRDAYETAAHELTRNLKTLRTTQTRLDRVQKSIDKSLRLEQIPDETVMHEFKTAVTANGNHLTTAEQTLRNLVGAPRQEVRSISDDDEYSSPILIAARHRHEEFRKAEKKRTIDLRREINDVCNGFNRIMTSKNVRWDRSKFRTLPRLMELDRQNFHTVFENLVDNAVKYAKPNTNIKLISEVEELQVVLTIVNIGPPIDIRGAEGSDIFVKRVRGLVAAQMTEGFGLGLWQARQVARLWGGDPLSLVFSEPIPAAPGDTHPWSNIGFQLELPILNPDHITLG